MSPSLQSSLIHLSSKSRTSKYPARTNPSVPDAKHCILVSHAYLTWKLSPFTPFQAAERMHKNNAAGPHSSKGLICEIRHTAALQHKSDLLVSVQVLLKKGLDLLLVVGQLLWGHCDDILHTITCVKAGLAGHSAVSIVTIDRK